MKQLRSSVKRSPGRRSLTIITRPVTLCSLPGACRVRRGDSVALDRYANQLIAHGEQHELPQWVVWGTHLQGPVLTAAGRAREAITRLEKALETAEHMQNRAFRPMVYSILAEAKFACGDRGSAVQLFDEALSLAECTGERWMSPELLRTKGGILLSDLHKEEPAEECFRHSIELARQQGSKMFELRSGLSLARIWRNIGKLTEARDLIFSIYNGLSEGFGVFELKEAEIWLRDLEEG
jgi:predicted ATPase